MHCLWQRVLTITGNSVKERFLWLTISLTLSGLFYCCYLHPPGTPSRLKQTQRIVCNNFHQTFFSTPWPDLRTGTPHWCFKIRAHQTEGMEIPSVTYSWQRLLCVSQYCMMHFNTYVHVLAVMFVHERSMHAHIPHVLKVFTFWAHVWRVVSSLLELTQVCYCKVLLFWAWCL